MDTRWKTNDETAKADAKETARENTKQTTMKTAKESTKGTTMENTTKAAKRAANGTANDIVNDTVNETILEEMYKPSRKERKQQNAMKKSKQIKAFLYRILAAGALFAMVFSGIMGREALDSLNRMGSNALSGDIYYLAAFREYITTLCLEAMTGYAGMGDDNGFPLTDENAQLLSQKNVEEFQASTRYAKNDLLYHIDVGGECMESSGISYPLFSEYDGHLLLPEDVTLCLYWNGPGSTLYFFGTEYNLNAAVNLFSLYAGHQYRPNMEKASDIRLLLAVRDAGSFTSDRLLRFRSCAQSYRSVLLFFFGNMVLWLLAAFLCLLSLRSAKQMWENFARYSLKLWLEVKLAFAAGCLYLCYYYCLWDLTYPSDYRISHSSYLWLYLPAGMSLYLLWKDWQYNGSSVWKHSLAGSILRFVKEFVSGLKWYRKTLLLSVGVLCNAFLMFCAAFVLQSVLSEMPDLPHAILFRLKALFGLVLFSSLLALLIFAVLLRFFRDTLQIVTKLSRLRNGTMGQPITLKKGSLLTQTAEDVNALEQGVEAAIEQRNRSNKMRVELITNVSHDLKTPLTSIINYADLLCEENLPAPAADYASALQEKAYRLKGMVQDVFDLSKATSGNLPVEKNVLDLAKLLKQTLADMDERIAESTLTFKLSIATEPLMIEADGEKLYRIFQNLIVNALQYSLEHSRVHIQLTAKDGYAYARVKNISRQELTFDPEEITERFVRADVSRTTDGSGLGLSIVQSFTEACGGIFHIDIDADMFTACVCFPLAENPTTT